MFQRLQPCRWTCHEKQEGTAIDVDPQGDLIKIPRQRKTYEIENTLSAAMNAIVNYTPLHNHPEI